MLRMDSLTRGFAMWAAIIGSSLFVTQAGMAQDCAGCGDTVVQGNAYGTGSGIFGERGRKYSSFAEWRQVTRQKIDHYKVVAEKVRQRNQAWPMPFDCADRQVYFSIWEPMIDKGFERQTMLMNQHFDLSTNELNDYGKATVSAIMRNMPSSRKNVFVHRHSDALVAESRLAAVKNAVSTWYGDELASRVAFTDTWHAGHSGLRIENVNRLYTEGLPAPWIPVASGTGSTSNVQAGN